MISNILVHVTYTSLILTHKTIVTDMMIKKVLHKPVSIFVRNTKFNVFKG